MKRVFNETKTTILTSYDLEKGYLRDDTKFIAHHDATPAIAEESHYEVLREYPSGGKDVCLVVDVAAAPAKEAWDEYEDIFVFVPYTAAELAERDERAYVARIESLIAERYSISAQIAILRQSTIKPAEFAAFNAYAEECKATAKSEFGRA